MDPSGEVPLVNWFQAKSDDEIMDELLHDYRVVLEKISAMV